MTTVTFLQHVPPQQFWQQEDCMRPGPSYAGIQKKGRTPRTLAARGGGSSSTMSSGSEDRSRDRRRATGQQDRVARRASTPRQLITFVDSQDPNSRSTIQRHTAHHSNAQRRDARLRSLRNTSRPRVLTWTRRQSAEAVPVASPTSSNSSSSISPLPPQQRPQPQADETAEQPAVSPERPTTQAREQFSADDESAVQFLIDFLCRHCPDRAECEEIVNYARTDEACTNLLLAYSISLRRHNGGGITNETDDDAARSYLNRGTSLLRARLSDPASASADTNIQAVLLLIAYTADYGTFDQVRIHANALRTMIDQRGGVGDENYPPILALQLRGIGSSRFFHLTLDCREPCEALLRFPRGLYGV